MNYLKSLQTSLLAMQVRNLTIRRSFILLALQDGTGECNSDFAKVLRASSANITNDFKWLLLKRLIAVGPLQPGDDLRHQKYVLTTLGRQAVIALALTK